MESGKPNTLPSDKNSEKSLLEEILGYLNFSSGSENPAFLSALNQMAESISHEWGRRPAAQKEQGTDQDESSDQPAWRKLHAHLLAGLASLKGSSKAFDQVSQAEAVLNLVFEKGLPAYQKYHRDLLFHQTDSTLFHPLFIGRFCEAVLKEGKPWEESDRIVDGAIGRINDFLGHRPVAALENEQKLQPYPHERVRPIPLWIQGVGSGVGPYGELIEKTIEIIKETDPTIRRQSWFDLDHLEELALDPRAYDFDHPVNRRPNYQFGQWDPHLIDNSGFYRRFVLQQVTIDGIMERLLHPEEDLSHEEILTEGATVLAGTILMGSGISGEGPTTHDSETSLSTLLPHIAAYRDRFYLSWLERFSETHQTRLKQEARALRQPFGGARQHLNQHLSQLRASQLQQVHLALLFARMGYPETARNHANVVPAASARMLCEIECQMMSAFHRIDLGQLEEAAAHLAEIEGLLHRGIECGALVDPWNILGFDAQFSLFHTLENSCYDMRVDNLLDLIEDIFGLYARLEREATAVGNESLRRRLSDNLASMAAWWDQFATTEVSAVEGISGQEAWESADRVAVALGAWHKAGTAAGDIVFWRKRVDEFHSAKAYALVVEALLDQNDHVAAMALLMQWLSEAENLPETEGNYPFYQLALRWMTDLWRIYGTQKKENQPTGNRGGKVSKLEPLDPWQLAQKFLDYLEAGSESLWEVPEFDLGHPLPNVDLDQWIEGEFEGLEEEEEENGAIDHLYDAAYENVVYRDTTDDGFEGEVFDDGDDALTDFELTEEAARLEYRLEFLTMVANLWTMIAAAVAREKPEDGVREKIGEWLHQAQKNQNAIKRLLTQIHLYKIPMPSGTEITMNHFQRRLDIKIGLLDRTVACCVATADAIRSFEALDLAEKAETARDGWEKTLREVFADLLRGNTEAIQQKWPQLETGLSQQPLLYLPLNRGGSPHRIVASRTLHHALQDLLRYLPRLGLFHETCRLLETIQRMEQDHPVGQGGITEFNHLFEIGYESIVESILYAPLDQETAAPYLESLEAISEPLMRLWIDHSHSIRLSPLEAIDGEARWRDLREFIKTYGGDLFTQTFLNYSNLRVILHEGVDAYLERLTEIPETEENLRLIADLDKQLPRDKAISLLGVILEAVMDNYNEYMDYNSSTTQSDHGEMLYTLLDYLRLTNRYDRIAWHLQPLVKAHEVLVRKGHLDEARQWEETFSQQTKPLSSQLLKNYDRLVKAYGMRLRSVADRLGQRFVRPLAIGRLRALISPAMDEAKLRTQKEKQAASETAPEPTPAKPGESAFEKLLEGLAPLTEAPTGVGFLVPKWLESLQEEADRHELKAEHLFDPSEMMRLPIPRHRLSLDQLESQVLRWAKEAFG